MLLKQSTARNRPILMVDSTDHVTGKTGLTLTITASKDGAAFASITPTVTELASGWYTLALTTAHTDTLGALAFHITSTGADPTDLADEVVLDLPGTGGSVTLSAAERNAIADATFNRDTSNFESTAPKTSLGAAVLGATHKVASAAGTQTVYKQDNTTAFATRTETLDSSADPVTAVTKLA